MNIREVDKKIKIEDKKVYTDKKTKDLPIFCLQNFVMEKRYLAEEE